MTAYEIEPDLEFWLPVPREFPGDGFQTPEEWAEDLSQCAIPDDAGLRETYRQLAVDVAVNQFEESSHTFWYSPEDGHALGTAHLAIFEDDPESSLEEIARPEYESVTPLHLESFKSGVFGKVVQTASTIASEEIAFDQIQASAAIGHIRTVGRSHGMIFVLEAYDADLTTLGFMMEPMVEFFESVSFAEDDEGEES
ncbi:MULTISPECIES: hypothetical protein [Glutamicibacter]|uniref:Uncharacterized protein n=1 Tax=Glutamicibacter halophytocola TaxID=1933880 RepID=A0A5B8IWW6_9MICC|nr:MULTISPECIES: hypothetical protein [Glutamicibacter]MBF6670681.1 hypothetical protein [Glutamicibacter sp. FBE19]QDY66420.1 hypothetical protein FQA45_08835 [Glutamicibacter halophytocola]UUX58527.1 hypothetical protein NUH22_14675 [Glutamicibacter halophytocola]